MKNTLKLHFRSPSKVKKCLAELKESGHTFTAEEGGPDMRDVLTKPEYEDIRAVATLTFKDEADCRKFMADPLCKLIYQRHST